MTRPGRDAYFLAMARLVATRSTCRRRSVGCVLVSELGHVLATGYNGRPRGFKHCNEVSTREPTRVVVDTAGDQYDVNWATYPHACPAAFAPSGSQLDGCEAIHAEQNALLQCRDVEAVAACYCTTAPCLTCVKLLLNTGCRRVVFAEDYPQAAAAGELWTRDPGVGQPTREWLRVLEAK